MGAIMKASDRILVLVGKENQRREARGNCVRSQGDRESY